MGQVFQEANQVVMNLGEIPAGTYPGAWEGQRLEVGNRWIVMTRRQVAGRRYVQVTADNAGQLWIEMQDRPPAA